MKKALLFVITIGCIVLIAQYTGKTITTIQGSGALPGTCAVGDTAFKTDATAGQNWYGCTAVNTWTQLGGSSAGGVQSGTFAALPACNASSTNSGYLVTTGPFLMVCNGSAWSTWWHSFIPGTMFNQTDWPKISGSATTIDTLGGIDITGTNNQGAEFRRAIAPTRPYRLWACADASYVYEGSNLGIYLMIANVADNKGVNIASNISGSNHQIIVQSTDAVNGFVGSTVSRVISGNQYFAPEMGQECYAIHETSTTRFYEISLDGKDWFVWYSEAVATYLIHVPDRAQIGVASSTNFPPSARLGVWGLDAL